METIRTTTDAGAAQIIQQKLYNAGIPCYNREEGGRFIIEVSQNDFAKAESILSLAKPMNEPMPIQISVQPESLTPLEAAETPAENLDALSEDVSLSEKSMRCLRCQTTLKFVGEEAFKTWGSVSEGSQSMTLYACSKCGHVEFFLPRNQQSTTFHVAAEGEAQVISQLMNGSGIPCQIVALASGFYEIKVAETHRSAAEIVLKDYVSSSSPRLLDAKSAQSRDGKILCTVCHSAPDYIGEKEFKLGMWTDEWARLKVYLCSHCYQIQLLDLREARIIDIELARQDRYDIFAERATQLINRKQLNEAIAIYEKLARDFPEWAEEPKRCIQILLERIAKGK